MVNRPDLISPPPADPKDAEIERLKDAMEVAIDELSPWESHCDYRAEGAIQAAIRLLRSATKSQ